MGKLASFQIHRTQSERVRIRPSGAASCALALLFLCAITWPRQADAQCASLTTLMNGTVADATAVMQNFSAINNNCAPIANPSFTGDVSISGSGASYWFFDRTNTANAWAWYSNGNIASLWKNFDSPGNVLSVDRNGDVSINGPGASYWFYDRTNTSDAWVWYSDGNTASLWKNFNSAGNVLSIDQDGRVGIGTSSPSRTLHVYSTDGLAFKVENNGTNDAVVEIQSDNDAVTAVNFNNSAGGTYGQIAYFQGTASNYMTFSTSGAERVRIDRSGNVGIGTTTPGYPLQINGNAFANSWQTPSDARLKKNISPISDALATIQHLQGIRFEWRGARERLVGKTLDLPTDEPQIGFIAQEVETVLPEAVSTAKGDGLMSVQESKIVPVLVEAVKELKAANDHQAGEITKLRTEIGELRRWKEKAAAAN